MKPGRQLWLLVRRGRLVATFPDVSPRSRVGLKRKIEAALELPPPSLTVRQWELDEINIIAGWLHKNREHEGAIALAGRSLDDAMDEGFALLTRPRSAMVAEKTPERVISGPDEDEE